MSYRDRYGHPNPRYSRYGLMSEARREGLEQGRKEGIAAATRAVGTLEGVSAAFACIWLDLPEGQAAVAAELAKIGGGT